VTAKPKSADAIAGGAFLLVGLGAVVGAIQLQIGTPSEPQPGFFPFLAGSLLMFLSGLLVVQGLRGRSSGGEPFTKLRQPVLAMMGLIGFVLVLEPLGYILATASLTAVLLLVLKVRRGLGYVLTVILLPVGSYLLFDRLLDVPLPEGILSLVLGA
jgi:putative tricarboxylic transport membrane protein